MKKKVTIIGCGKVGSAFALELSSAGYEIVCLISRSSDKSERLAELIPGAVSSDNVTKDAIESADLIIVSVQDREIEGVVKEISRLECKPGDKTLLHTSGSETSAVLQGTGISSENCASMHPIQTFMSESNRDMKLLKGIYFGIEGGAGALKVAEEIAESLNSRCVIIQEDKKQLYHTACVVSSNFLVTLLNVAAEFSASVGIEKGEMFNVFRPIIEKTISNVSNNGLTESLTGPFERNDLNTIAKHLDSISAEIPSLTPFYTLLGMETVRVAFRKESLNMKNVIMILDLLNEYVVREQKIADKMYKE